MAAGTALDFWQGKKGAERQNEENRRQAREQMQFQREMAGSAERFSERMANTAMQRRVADLRLAGLNPALAYENAAAAPAGVTAGGASARMENTASGALQFAQLRQSMQLAAQGMVNQTRATNADVDLKTAQQAAATAAARASNAAADHTAAVQPHDVRRLELANILQELGITGAENDAELEKKIQTLGTGSTRTLLQAIRAVLRPR